MNSETFTTDAQAILINGVLEEDFSYPQADNDEDLNGNNGLEYVWDEAQELGFDNNWEYFLSLLPNKKPTTIEQLKENWDFICEKVYGNDGYYHWHETDFRTIELKQFGAVVLVASANGELGA